MAESKNFVPETPRKRPRLEETQEDIIDIMDQSFGDIQEIPETDIEDTVDTVDTPAEQGSFSQPLFLEPD